MNRLAPFALLIAGFAALASPARAVDAKEFKRQFMEKQNSWERIALIKALDPKDKASLNLLTEFVLKQLDWYYREAAIEVLATAYDPELIEELEKLAGKRGDPIIAEGIIMAFGQGKQKDRIPLITEQLLSSKKMVVKRACAIALGMMPDKRAVDPLIKAWENEKDFMVWVHILENLEKITQEKNMPTAQDWRGWWEAVKDTWEVPPPKEDNGDGEAGKSGEVMKTKVRGVDLEFRSRGKGLPLLVLPEYGYEKDYLETYLRNLEETNQILYMKLPGASDFDPPPPNAPNLPAPWYPLERIVEAFEELHEQLVKEGKIQDKPFAIMAHGLTTWVAMTYASKHPRKVRRMILIAPSSGGKAWGEGRDRVEKKGKEIGDIEMEHYAQTQLFENGQARYTAKGDEESEAINRKGHTLYFADTRDLEIGRIYGPIVEKKVGERGIARVHASERPMGSVFIPDFSLFKLERSPTPTLIMHGALSTRVSIEDCEAIAKHYQPAAKVVTFKRSDRMPFIEENERFVENVQKFMGSAR